MRARALELIRFGSVGALAFVVDTGLFNLVRFGPGELLHHKPITAKVLSVAVATVVAWLGNRYWTFPERRRAQRTRELVLFGAVNVVGMLIAVACLAVSHYVLELTSPLADNIAANGVGLVLGTLFRYVAYRSVVFTGRPHDLPSAAADLATTTTSGRSGDDVADVLAETASHLVEEARTTG